MICQTNGYTSHTPRLHNIVTTPTPLLSPPLHPSTQKSINNDNNSNNPTPASTSQMNKATLTAHHSPLMSSSSYSFPHCPPLPLTKNHTFHTLERPLIACLVLPSPQPVHFSSHIIQPLTTSHFQHNSSSHAHTHTHTYTQPYFHSHRRCWLSKKARSNKVHVSTYLTTSSPFSTHPFH